MHMLQAREAELERTVQDLNAALVATRGTASDSNASGGNATGDVSLQSRVQSLEADLETANSYLALEKERVSANAMAVFYFEVLLC